MLLLCGIISGYPIGAKIATDFREKNFCSKEECERLLSFTNNSGPLFIIGTVGISMFHSTTIGLLLFITHILACITVGIIFRFWKRNKETKVGNISFSSSNKNKYAKSASFSNLGEILAQSITSGITTIVLIGGFVVIFSCIISILKSTGLISVLSNLINPLLSIFNIDTSFSQGLITGVLEITNGISYISTIVEKKLSVNIIFTAFLLGFGGISILLQVLSITSKTDLSIKPYLYGKILQAFLAAFYTYIFVNVFPFFNFDI